MYRIKDSNSRVLPLEYVNSEFSKNINNKRKYVDKIGCLNEKKDLKSCLMWITNKNIHYR